MQEQPLVSVIIPVYNREKFLAAAIDSVLSQTYRHIQIIVVDDGSTDQSGTIARSYADVEYIYQENQGVSLARNKGIDAAQGEFIALLDSDDMWLPNKLETQIIYMLKNPHIDITLTRIKNFLEPDTEIPDSDPEVPSWFNCKYALQDSTGFTLATMLSRRSVFNRVGYFSSEYQSLEDVEWLWRAKDQNIYYEVIPEALVLRRFHGSNLSWQTSLEVKSTMFKIIKQSIARKSNFLAK